jgi:hypothetical protein
LSLEIARMVEWTCDRRFGRQRQVVHIGIVALAWGLAVGIVGEARELPTSAFPSIVVRTYDAAATPTDAQASALLVAAAILDRAGVRVQWIRCDPDVHAAECRAPLGAYEVAVRLITVRERPTPSARLGAANVDVVRGGGSLATVYANRVRWFAEASGVDFSTVLGRAIAHEIGHLVIGSTRHESIGLMRAVWTPNDVDGEHWLFTERDALALRQACRVRAQDVSCLSGCFRELP